MNSQQLDDQAAEARDEAAERTEALDQLASELSGKLVDLEDDLATAQRETAELQKKLEEWDRIERAASGQLLAAIAELQDTLKTLKGSP